MFIIGFACKSPKEFERKSEPAKYKSHLYIENSSSLVIYE